jgi:Na+/alanine symporter
MATKHLSILSCCLTGATTLSAQSAVTTLRTATGTTDRALYNIIDQVEQNALLVLISLVAIISILWLGYILKTCVDLSKKRSSNPLSTLFLLLLLGVGLSLSGSSCTATQQARVADIKAAQAAERSTCLLPNHDRSWGNHPSGNRQPAGGYTNWNNAYTCKYCGQRVFTNR